MHSPKLNFHQSGVALILSLLLLFVLTLVAVASFSSSHIQERAASNVRLQTLAFEAASAGTANAVDFFLANVEADAPDTLCGRPDHVGWPDPTEWREVTYDVDNVRLEQRMYCLADEYPCGVVDEDCVAGTRPPRSQLFVASRGFVDGNGSVMATREVEVRITRRNDTFIVEGCGAICFAACEFDLDPKKGDPMIDFPSSNVFQVDGGGGPAVTTGLNCPDSSLYDAIMGDIKDSRIGNYDGGIHQQDPGAPWNDPVQTEAFRDAIETAAMGTPNLHFDGDHTDNGNTVYGTLDSPLITYVKGDLSMGGNISGAGIMMVEGDIAWNGTPGYKGLIVSLGGHYTIDGGGTGGNHAGSVVVLNTTVPFDGSDFGPIGWENTGGGTAEYNWDCDTLLMAFNMVSDGIADNSENPWGFTCERGPPTLFETPAELVIASWRENIGWREDYFASE